MTLDSGLDTVALVLVLIGAVLCLTATIGLLRWRDVPTRLHAATKPQVLGLVLVCLGLGLQLRDARASGILVLVVLAQMVTAPVAGHMVGRASYRAGQVRGDLLVVDELSDGPAHEEPRGAP